MANKARITIKFVAQASEGETLYVGLFSNEGGGSELLTSINAIASNLSGSAYYQIGNGLIETANNLYQYLDNNYSSFAAGMTDQYTVILQALDYQRFFDIFTQDGSGWGTLEENGKVQITVTEEVNPESEFNVNYNFNTAQVNPACDFVRVIFNQTAGVYPITINYSVDGVGQQKTANNDSELWIERERYYTSLDPVFLTDDTGTSRGVQVPAVRMLDIPIITLEQDFNLGNIVTVQRNDNNLGYEPTVLFSIDDVVYTSNNIFQDVPAGQQTFYTRDSLGCTTNTVYVVPEFQISEIYAVHNPLNFTIEKTNSPENVPCVIEVDGNSIGTFRAIPFDSYNGTNRYILFADEPIRANMPSFDDYPQPQNSLITVNNISARIKITEEETGNVIAEFVAVNAARQLGGEGAKMTNLVNNEEPAFVFVEGQPGYAYFYDNDFFREKLLLTANTDVTRLGITKPVEVLPHCTGDVILKYLDRNGMYRFYKFDKAYSISLEPEQIGRTQTIFESIATAQGVTKNIGYKNEKQLSVTAIKVPDKHMDSLQDVFVSPRVYMHVGALGLDARENWVLVDVEGDGEVKHPKRKFNDIRLTLTMPEQYNVTML